MRFFLMCSPRWLFFIPGWVLMLLGIIGYVLALPGLTIGPATFDAHTLLFASLAIMSGYESVVFGIFTKAFAINEGLLPPDWKMDRFASFINLEKGLILGVLGLLAGTALLLWAVLEWRNTGFGRLDYSHTMRFVIPGATLVSLGLHTILASFLVTILGMGRRD